MEKHSKRNNEMREKLIERSPMLESRAQASAARQY